MGKIALIDYKMGNLFSIANACEKAGLEVEITSNASKIKSADAIILPGVGAYPLAVEQLKENDLANSIYEFAQSGKYVLGICLGMQLLMEESDEFGIHKGLGIIEGNVMRFPEKTSSGKQRFIPQITWNNIKIEIDSHPLFKEISDEDFFYFVHSNYVHPKHKNNILCTTTYTDFNYCSAVIKNNIFGIQFHPEKSGMKGLQIFKNFKNLIH